MMAEVTPIMSRRIWVLGLPLLLLFFYLGAFGLQERRYGDEPSRLTHPVPPILQEIALGYLRQLGGEIQFVKAAVFSGGGISLRDNLEYGPPLAGRLTAAAQLHPHFIDTYYLAQAVLPYIHDDLAEAANRIHARGLAARPDQFVLPFFIGFNHFYYLKEPAQAANYLRQAVEIPGAPFWFGHLAATLAGEGGDIYGGLVWLRAMLAAEEDEHLRERYQHSIAMFERAVTVQEAVTAYHAERGEYPESLALLEPDYLPALPEFAPPFELSWQPPDLRLLRVH